MALCNSLKYAKISTHKRYNTAKSEPGDFRFIWSAVLYRKGTKVTPHISGVSEITYQTANLARLNGEKIVKTWGYKLL